MTKISKAKQKLLDAIAKTKVTPKGLLESLSMSATMGFMNSFGLTRSPIESIMTPIYGMILSQAFSWIDEKAGRRVIIEANSDGTIELWAEENGNRRIFNAGGMTDE